MLSSFFLFFFADRVHRVVVPWLSRGCPVVVPMPRHGITFRWVCLHGIKRGTATPYWLGTGGPSDAYLLKARWVSRMWVSHQRMGESCTDGRVTHARVRILNPRQGGERGGEKKRSIHKSTKRKRSLYWMVMLRSCAASFMPLYLKPKLGHGIAHR